MNPMEQEMEHEELGSVREIVVEMEEESMQCVLEDGPNEVPNKKTYSGFCQCSE